MRRLCNGFIIKTELQMSFKKRKLRQKSLADLAVNEEGILSRIDLPADVGGRLMELGFLPGHPVKAVRSAPSGDPRVYLVEGAEIALRRETSIHLILESE
jgi:ferrous iron transport protein A